MDIPVTELSDIKGLVYVKYHGALTVEQQRAYNEDAEGRIRTMTAEGRRAVLVIDTTDSEPGGAESRRVQADWQKAFAAELKATTLLAVFVAPSRLVRGGLTALSWMNAFPFPISTVATVEEALDVADAELAKAGLEQLGAADRERVLAAAARPPGPRFGRQGG